MTDSNDLLGAINRLIALGARDTTLIPAKLDTCALVPQGFVIQDTTSIAEAGLAHPRHKKATVEFYDAGSFIQYFNDHKNDGASQIFAVPDSQVFRAILDYHGVTEERAAGWCRHKATFTLKATPEWAQWLSFNSRAMNQNDFAEFLENNASDIVKPSPAAIIDVCRMLNIRREVNFSSGIQLAGGNVQLVYTESDKGTVGTGEVTIPEEFTIRVAPFIGTDPRDVVARLRYRLKDGKLSLFYDLHQKDKIASLAFNSAVKAISEATGTKVLLGVVKE